MKKLMCSAALLIILSQGLYAAETIHEVYEAIGDTVFFPLVVASNGKTVTNSAGKPLKTRIDEKGRFLAYLEDGSGWAVNTFKFWPLPDGGAIAATMVGSFEAETMFADSYAEFYAHGPGDTWDVIEPPMENQLDVSYFLDQAPAFRSPEEKEIFEETTWGLFYELLPEREYMLVRLTATNREKCWPERVFGAKAEPVPQTASTAFCRNIYARLTNEALLKLDPEKGQFDLVPFLRKSSESPDVVR